MTLPLCSEPQWPERAVVHSHIRYRRIRQMYPLSSILQFSKKSKSKSSNSSSADAAIRYGAIPGPHLQGKSLNLRTVLNRLCNHFNRCKIQCTRWNLVQSPGKFVVSEENAKKPKRKGFVVGTKEWINFTFSKSSWNKNCCRSIFI